MCCSQSKCQHWLECERLLVAAARDMLSDCPPFIARTGCAMGEEANVSFIIELTQRGDCHPGTQTPDEDATRCPAPPHTRLLNPCRSQPTPNSPIKASLIQFQRTS